MALASVGRKTSIPFDPHPVYKKWISTINRAYNVIGWLLQIILFSMFGQRYSPESGVSNLFRARATF